MISCEYRDECVAVLLQCAMSSDNTSKLRNKPASFCNSITLCQPATLLSAHGTAAEVQWNRSEMGCTITKLRINHKHDEQCHCCSAHTRVFSDSVRWALRPNCCPSVTVGGRRTSRRNSYISSASWLN